MNTGLYSGIAAMRSSEQRLQAITANLANASTPAYKRRTAVSRSFDVGVGDRRHREIKTTFTTDFTQGRIERTENPLALALKGEGFFAVEGPNGEAFTRNGSFQLDDTGVLQTAEGHAVVWDGGRGRIDPVGEAVRIDTSGRVFQGASDVGRLKVVAFESPDLLRLDSQAYFHDPGGLTRSTTDAEVHQFALERSNASTVDELIAMITVQRGFESATNLLKMLDQTYRRLNRAR
jgi:flagellar basal-body rod protein FlgF